MTEVLTLIYWGIMILSIVFIIWFIKLLRLAVMIKAIKGFKDKIIIALLFFFGIIFAIIYLKIKIKIREKTFGKTKIKQEKNKPKKKSEYTKFWKRIGTFFGALWFLIWKDDSLKGWVFGLIFLFVFIKFIFFPTMSLLTGTAIPLAIVESCSMYHEGNLLSNFDNWWEEHESKYEPYIINQLDFQDFIFKRGLNKGDILFVIRATPEKLEVGDVIIFNGAVKYPIIHRIIKIENKNDEYIFQTIGDNNNQQLSFETNIKEEQLVGKAVFKIAPYLGWGKLIFFEANKPPQKRGLCKEN